MKLTTIIKHKTEGHVGEQAQSQAIAAEEAFIGNFTRRELKRLSTWPLWEAGDIAYSIS